MSNTDPIKNRERTQGLATGKQFLLLLRHSFPASSKTPTVLLSQFMKSFVGDRGIENYESKYQFQIVMTNCK